MGPHTHHPTVATGLHGGLRMSAPIARLRISSPWGPRMTVGSTGRNASHFSRVMSPTSRRGIRARIIFICFTRPIRHSIDWIHTMPLPLVHWRPRPPGINLVTYNIQDICGFGLPQAIRSVKLSTTN